MVSVEELNSLNFFISNLEKETLGLQKAIEKLERELNSFENKAQREVANAVDLDGKKLFTNELQRKVEVELRLNNSVAFVELQNSLSAVKDSQKDKIVDLNFKKREFKIQDIISRGG